MNATDFEFIVILLLLVFLFLIGLRKKCPVPSANRLSGIDLPMSVALKGIACVLILMGHFVNRRIAADVHPTLFSSLIYWTSANVALVLFMYFSGYGLSLQRKFEGHISLLWLKRLAKVYFPLLFTCIVAMSLFAFLPVKFSTEEAELLSVPKDIAMLHDLSINNIETLVLHTLGWKDWYVFCIILFYSFFYLSKILTYNSPTNQSWVLWLFFVAYFILAYLYFGPPEAHWYRFCWVFFMGHIHAKMVNTGKIRIIDIAMLAILMSTAFFEWLFMIISYFIALLILLICTIINKKYVMESRVLAFMGSISFFFYLSHIRIGYTLVTYINIYSVIFWLLLTIIISVLLKNLYFFIKSILVTKVSQVMAHLHNLT